MNKLLAHTLSSLSVCEQQATSASNVDFLELDTLTTHEQASTHTHRQKQSRKLFDYSKAKNCSSCLSESLFLYILIYLYINFTAAAAAAFWQRKKTANSQFFARSSSSSSIECMTRASRANDLQRWPKTTTTSRARLMDTNTHSKARTHNE